MAYFIGRITYFSGVARTHRSMLVSWVAMQAVVLGLGGTFAWTSLSRYQNTKNGWWIGLAVFMAAAAIAMSTLSIGMLKSHLFPRRLHKRH